MPRFFLPPELWTGLESGELVLPPTEAHHAIAVLRCVDGEEVSLLDGAGRIATGRLEIRGKKAAAVVQLSIHQAPPLAGRLSLAVAIPKGTTMDWIVEKAVELGANDIFPLITERTISRPKGDEVKAKQEKWQRTALEACKQCGQPWLPIVHEPKHWPAWHEAHPSTQWQAPLIASLEPNSQPIRSHLPASCCVIIGPEGDLSPVEYQLARDRGWQPVTLGPLVLRVETAALFSLSVMAQARMRV